MNIKVNDELVLKSNRFFGKAGDVFVVNDIVQDGVDGLHYVTVRRDVENAVTHFTCPMNNLDAYFEPVPHDDVFDDGGIGENLVMSIIDNSEIKTGCVFDKCFVMAVNLPNGYSIVESYDFDTPDAYDEDVAYEECMNRVLDKIIELEYYVNMYDSNVEILFEDYVDDDCFCDNCCENRGF